MLKNIALQKKKKKKNNNKKSKVIVILIFFFTLINGSKTYLLKANFQNQKPIFVKNVYLKNIAFTIQDKIEDDYKMTPMNNSALSSYE